MKAAIRYKYGSPDVVNLEEVDRPIPGDDEVLVRVHAASVNAWDWDLLIGTAPNRLMFGFAYPKRKILGADVAGRVEAVGKNVTEFQPGDEVFGDQCEKGWGGFAEYVCAGEASLALKPANITFEQAAAVPQAAVMALQAIRDFGSIEPGQAVLINGAGGGVGTFAIQIAKSLGAVVTGVDSASKLEMIRSIGADHVIDYTHEDFSKNDKRYDLIIDTAAHRSMLDARRALTPKGSYVVVGGSLARIFQLLLLKPWLAVSGGRRMSVLGLKPNKDLRLLAELLSAGKIVPIIERVYPLREVPAALQHMGDGRVQGKIVVTV